MGNKKDIGLACYISYSSKAELVCPDTNTHIALTPTEYRIICYLVDNANSPVQLEAIATYLWGSNYHADSKDPESIKSHITRIRTKLARLHPALKDSLETNYGYGSYTYKITQTVLASHKEDCILSNSTGLLESYASLADEVMRLSKQMDSLVTDLEAIQQKLDFAKASKNQIWEGIYGAQFDSMYFNFVYIKDALAEKQASVQRIKNSLAFNCEASPKQPDRAPNTIACIPSYTMSMLHEVQDLTSSVAEMQAKTNSLALEVDELICEYMSGAIDVYELQEILSKLPCNRNTALALVSLTNSFDMFELYEVIFTEYAPFLTEEELFPVLERAKKVFHPEVLQLWRLCETAPDNNDRMKDIIHSLPADRKSALTLISLTDSFDEPELYDAIFTEYMDFLSEDERAHIQAKARRIFASWLLEIWGLCE